MKGLTRQQLLEAGKKKLQQFREQKRLVAETEQGTSPSPQNNQYANYDNSISAFGTTQTPPNQANFRSDYSTDQPYNSFNYENSVPASAFDNNSLSMQIKYPNHVNKWQGESKANAMHNNGQVLGGNSQVLYGGDGQLMDTNYVPSGGLANAYASLSDAYLGSNTPTQSSQYHPNSNLNLNSNSDQDIVDYKGSPFKSSIENEISLSTSFLPQNYIKSSSNDSTPRDNRLMQTTIPEAENDSFSEQELEVQHEYDEDFSLIPNIVVVEQEKLVGDGEQGERVEGENQDRKSTVIDGESRQQMNFLSQLEQSRADGYKQQIKELQSFIDELTREKYELMRGLEKQNQITTDLAAEQEVAGERLIAQQRQNEELKEQLQAQGKELQALQMAHLTFAGERDAARQALEESQQRARELAAEIVHMEDNVQRSQLDVATREKGMDETRKQIVDLENKLKNADKNRLNLESKISQLEADKKNLMVRLRDLALNKGMKENESAKPIVLDASTQTEVEQQTKNDVVVQNEQDQEYVNQGGQISAQRKVSTELVQQALQRLTQKESQQVPQVLEDLSEYIPSRSMFSLPEQILTDQQTVLQGINQLVDNLEVERKQLHKFIRAKDDEITQLKTSNKELLEKIQNQTQRLEHEIQSRQQHLNHTSKSPNPSPISQDAQDVQDVRDFASTPSLDIPPLSLAEPEDLKRYNSPISGTNSEIRNNQSEIKEVVKQQIQSRGWSFWGRPSNKAKNVSNKL